MLEGRTCNHHRWTYKLFINPALLQLEPSPTSNHGCALGKLLVGIVNFGHFIVASTKKQFSAVARNSMVVATLECLSPRRRAFHALDMEKTCGARRISDASPTEL